MNAEERRILLLAMAGLAHREAEKLEHLERVFLPLPAHRLALRPEINIIRGGRGAGKSALFKLLTTLHTSDRIRALFDDARLPDAVWIEAFAQSMLHPSEAVLDHLATDHDDDALRAFWLAHLVMRVAEECPDVCNPPAELRSLWLAHRADPARWVPLAKQQIGALDAALRQAEVALDGRNTTVFAAYDHLDRIGAFAPLVRRRYVAALHALWLGSASRYRRIRSKIFLRDDLLEPDFPDASKLRSSSVSIDWEVEHLYRAAVRHMAEVSPELRGWLQGIERGFVLEEKPTLGWMPGPMPEEVQKAFADRLAGEVMGAGVRKGYTYRWIPNHLQDAQKRVVPRSFLVLLGKAASRAAERPMVPGPRLLTPQDLNEALIETSRERVDEIREEYRLVNRLERLRDMSVPLAPAEIVALIAQPVQGEPEGLSADGRAVFDELIRLGVLAIRTDGRVDVPDIYRYGFGIKRKGGAPRPA